MTTRVSAIIIVLNGEQFIAEAITSIFRQTAVSPEILVVDDGSQDRTRDIVMAMRDGAPAPLSLLEHPGGANLGMSASRNLGIARAKGELVAFLDADDVWLDGKLAEQAAILDAEPATAMVYGRTWIWHSWDPACPIADYQYDLGVRPDVTYPAGALFRSLLSNRYQTPTTCNAMIRKAALRDIGGFDESFRDMFEDQLTFAKLMLRFPVHVSSRSWARYRQHAAATSSALRDPAIADIARLRYLEALQHYATTVAHGSAWNRAALSATLFQLRARIGARSFRKSLRQARR